MGTTELLNTMALMASSTHELKAGYVLDYHPVGVIAVMAALTERYGRAPSEMHLDAETTLW